MRAFVILALATAGCGVDPTPPLPDGGDLCGAASDCSDGTFCNGAESCDPEHPAADERGCVPGVPPCPSGQTCDEVAASCVSDCAVTPDADGDGHDAIECGGDDCDDTRADRFPGNVEVCDEGGLDEDCDPSTIGPDADGDGAIDARCCNTVGGELSCGTDCDDGRASVGPGGTEVCNGIDEDCDGALDEGVLEIAYPDFDGDGWGNAAGARERACDGDPLYAAQPGDCNDASSLVYPGADEVCDGRDNDCDADPSDEIDVDRDGYLDAASTCTGLVDVDCDDLDPTVFPAAPEQCNDVDDDCDGGLDERAGTGGSDAFCAARMGDGLGFCAARGATHGCVISACPIDRADCDANPANGCEVDLASDRDNCGGCGVRCPGTCRDGLCGAPAEGDVLDLALSPYGGCLLREATAGSGEGAIECWGDVWSLPLGGYPTAVSAGGVPITDARAIDTSIGNLYFLRSSGEVWSLSGSAGAWAPTRVAGLPAPITRIAAGELGGCAIDTAGALSCWRGRDAPTAMFAGEQFDDVSVGESHACAVRTDGLLVCWGSNGAGQLGLPTDGVEHTREEVAGAFASVRAGERHTCAERSTGEIVCWGSDGRSPAPITAAVAANVLPAASGLDAGTGLSCAVVAGEVWCWGEAQRGSGVGLPCGPETNERDLDPCGSASDSIVCGASNACEASDTDPLRVRLASRDDVSADSHLHALTNATRVTVGGRSACAIVDRRHVYCWGDNTNRQLAVDESLPLLRLALPQRSEARLADAALGRSFGCGRRQDGTLRCWGLDDAGELGVGVNGVFLAPVDPALGLRGVRGLSLGERVGCAALATGGATCWGGVGAGPAIHVPLGDGSTWNEGSSSAVAVSGLSAVRAVSVGREHACALVGGGEVWCWGSNAGGQIGAAVTDTCGTSPCALTPVRVALPGPAAQVVVAGPSFGSEGSPLTDVSCARLVDGRVACWGSSGAGVLGLGSSSTRIDTPSLVSPALLGETVDLAVSASHACALQASGRAWCWGISLVGGAPDVCGGLPCTRPERVPGLTDALDVEAGLGVSCALRPSGALACWGLNDSGEAGDGTTGRRDVPAGSVTLPAGARGAHLANETLCATLVTDELYCWGREEHGERGDGVTEVPVSTRNPLLPRPAPGL